MFHIFVYIQSFSFLTESWLFSPLLLRFFYESRFLFSSENSLFFILSLFHPLLISILRDELFVSILPHPFIDFSLYSNLFSAELRETLKTFKQEHLLKYVDEDKVTEEEAKKLLAQVCHSHCPHSISSLLAWKDRLPSFVLYLWDYHGGRQGSQGRHCLGAFERGMISLPLLTFLDCQLWKDAWRGGWQILEDRYRGRSPGPGRCHAHGWWPGILLVPPFMARVLVFVLICLRVSTISISPPVYNRSACLWVGKSLFQMQAERIRRVQDIVSEQFGCRISFSGALHLQPATSPGTSWPLLWPTPTPRNISFVHRLERLVLLHLLLFDEYNYFGLDRHQVYWFQQGTLPCIDNEGKIILSKKYEVCAKTRNDRTRLLLLLMAMEACTCPCIEMASLTIWSREASSTSRSMALITLSWRYSGRVDGDWIDPWSLVHWLFHLRECSDRWCLCCQELPRREGRCHLQEERQVQYRWVLWIGLYYCQFERWEGYASMPFGMNAVGELVYSAGYICNSFYTVDFLDQKCNPEVLPRVYVPLVQRFIL